MLVLPLPLDAPDIMNDDIRITGGGQNHESY